MADVAPTLLDTKFAAIPDAVFNSSGFSSCWRIVNNSSDSFAMGKAPPSEVSSIASVNFLYPGPKMTGNP